MARSRNSKKQLPEQVTPEQATAILKQAEQDNINACGEEVEKVLNRFGCIMEPQIMMVIKRNPTPNQGAQMHKVADLLSAAEEITATETPEEKEE